MNKEFKLPELGENITSGDVVKVLVREGDAIAANDGVIELETDKAVVEIPCPRPARWPRFMSAGTDDQSGAGGAEHRERRRDGRPRHQPRSWRLLLPKASP